MKFAWQSMELAAMSSPAPQSVWSCCAEGTKCAWRFHPTWLASSSRPGLRRSPTGRTREEQLGRGFRPQLLEDPESDQRGARRQGVPQPGAGRR